MLKRLDGTAIKANPVAEVVQYLEALPKDVVVSSRELADALQIPLHHFKDSKLGIKEYSQRSLKIGTMRYWGSAATIWREKDAQKS